MLWWNRPIAIGTSVANWSGIKDCFLKCHFSNGWRSSKPEVKYDARAAEG